MALLFLCTDLLSVWFRVLFCSKEALYFLLLSCSYFKGLRGRFTNIPFSHGFVPSHRFVFGLGLACQGQSCHTKNQLLPKPFIKKKTSKSVKYPWPLHYKKKRAVEITMHLGLDNN